LVHVYKRVSLLYTCGTAVLLGVLWVVADRPAPVVVGSACAVVVLSAVVGWVAIGRELHAEGLRSRAEAAYREQQRELTEAMQFIRTEVESHGLIKRYLERLLTGTSVVVLTCNNSENKLLPATDLNGDRELAERLVHAEPSSCLAVRSGRSHREKPDGEQLLSCELCAGLGRSSTCMPALVGGEVIGSILVQHDRPLGKEEWRHAIESVSQTAPSLANLRTLAMAEARASTDALTGLPNRRTLDDTLKRVLAQAGRSLSPVSAILFDLDDFKLINDLHGHEKGDELLASVGAVVSTSIRQSDVAGRSGGEEFLVVLPDTDLQSALVVAEKLRDTIVRITVPGIEQAVSGSFGVAVYPDDATDPAGLLRSADRALYRAKSNGKNRVEIAAVAADEPEGASRSTLRSA
jgi:diguanylate cyclase (GGDEF)-like protein